ncbi:hypothetical protein ASG92_25450 [Arthrobacter sp. Soil736]|uniref:hypothetical protein n=1 Tax=Arthrobacter sp. Soil736 TaxID=1736395 RepID=UPI0006F25007|nr:hypothetical protein [Arthrobacter sp. Soil736]KRE52397.1 hypothetical protein ASG92_25450 [Arthrobacter sp. Soil736]
MKKRLRSVFWWELGGAALSAGLLLATLINKEWIETVFGIDPDAGSGVLEWAIVAALSVVTLGLLASSRVEWRRSQPG